VSTKYQPLTSFVSRSYYLTGWVTAVDSIAVAEIVDAERSSLADLLESLSAEQMRAPSLCVGWTVREVVAHLTLVAVGPGRATVELIRYRGSLARTGRETARRLAARESDNALIARLRGMVGKRAHFIATSYLDPLVDIVVHGQDIAVPLQRNREMPLRAGAAAAQRVATMRYWSRIRRTVGGVPARGERHGLGVRQRHCRMRSHRGLATGAHRPTGSVGRVDRSGCPSTCGGHRGDRLR
jgi:uncharacterized protein (TIGR03083 family)